MKSPRLFTVLYFSVRSSRSSALCYGLPSCMSVKTTKGEGAVWEEATLPPPPRAIIPDAHPLGTFENQGTSDGTTRYV